MDRWRIIVDDVLAAMIEVGKLLSEHDYPEIVVRDDRGGNGGIHIEVRGPRPTLSYQQV